MAMNTDILRKIGLTEGEIRVYTAMVPLGKASTGPIMQKSGISSSKVYLILEKLMQKGLVSFVVENNVRKFQVANPSNITEYLNRQQHEIEVMKQESEAFIRQVSQVWGRYEEESAQIYKGFAGMRVAFDSLLGELDKGDEFLFFSQSREELTNAKVKTFFKNLHQKRLEKGIRTKGIADTGLKDLFAKDFTRQKHYDMRFSRLTMPTAISIGRKRILLNIWGDNPICFEIISERIAAKHREFFYDLWEDSK
jgi:HTH-type transcriptional regulator, sugar sensing transcriptional regulator